jgi:glutathione S-transferase
MSGLLEIVIGNRNYSSWSLRGWLAIKHTGLLFTEIFIPLDMPDSKAQIAANSKSGLVPVLKVDGFEVWDSLAIIETLDVLAPDAGLWPDDFDARARARSVSAEMHSGFYPLRRDMPMDLRGSHPGVGHTDKALANAARICDLWTDCRDSFGAGGDFLFGKWSAADMMYAPVVGRFRTFGVPVDAKVQKYMDAVWAQPDMAEWVQGAKDEPYTINIFG